MGVSFTGCQKKENEVFLKELGGTLSVSACFTWVITVRSARVRVKMKTLIDVSAHQELIAELFFR